MSNTATQPDVSPIRVTPRRGRTRTLSTLEGFLTTEDDEDASTVNCFHQPTKKLSEYDHQELRMLTRRLRFAKVQMVHRSRAVDRLERLLSQISVEDSATDDGRETEMSLSFRSISSNGGEQ
jgi:hypothetical protein